MCQLSIFLSGNFSVSVFGDEREAAATGGWNDLTATRPHPRGLSPCEGEERSCGYALASVATTVLGIPTNAHNPVLANEHPGEYR
jgi:hypothetical protein